MNLSECEASWMFSPSEVVTHLGKTSNRTLLLLDIAFLHAGKEDLRGGKNCSLHHVSTRNMTTGVSQDCVEVQDRITVLHVGELTDQRHHAALKRQKLEGSLHFNEVHLVSIDGYLNSRLEINESDVHQAAYCGQDYATFPSGLAQS